MEERKKCKNEVRERKQDEGRGNIERLKRNKDGK